MRGGRCPSRWAARTVLLLTKNVAKNYSAVSSGEFISEYSEGRLLLDDREVLVEHVELGRDPLVPAEGAFDRLAEADLGLVLVLVEIHDASAFAVDLMETARASIADQTVPDGI